MVAVATAVATAVITGSLVVGDSVSGSIRDTALGRLGRIHFLLTAPGFFRAALAQEVVRTPSLQGHVPRAEALLLTQGAAQNEQTQATVPSVNVVGITEEFFAFYDRAPSIRLSEHQGILNRALADDLGVGVGDTLFLSLDQHSAVPADTLFAHRKREATLHTLRLRVAHVLPPGGMGDLRLDASPLTPRNLFLSRDWLATQLRKEGRANAIAFQTNASNSTATENRLRKALAATCTLADYGLRLTPAREGATFFLSSERILLSESQIAAAHRAAADCGAQATLTSINLATTLRRVSGGRTIAYAVIAGLEPPTGLRFLQGGGNDPGPDGIWLNEWAFTDLGAPPLGERLELETLVPSWDGRYHTKKTEFTLRGVVAMTGFGAEPSLVPHIAGITEARRIDEWSVPFPVDLSRITTRDEAYWQRYRAAPKAFVSLDTMRGLWQGARWGSVPEWVTAVRIRIEGAEGAPAGLAASLKGGASANPGLFSHARQTAASALVSAYAAALRRHLKPADSGLVLRPIQKEVLAASAGTTDFGNLFLAMSMVLVLSAAGLASTTLRLMVERRAAEAGILLATGFTNGAVLGVILGEGALLALLGAALGLPLGVLYAGGVLRWLTTRWVEAVGTRAIWLHLETHSLVAGGLSGLGLGLLAVWWGTQHLTRRGVLDLLAGWRALEVITPRSTRPPFVLLMTGLLAAVCLLAGAWIDRLSATTAFFGAGAALLVATLSACSLALRWVLQLRRSAPSLLLLAARSAAANHRRSVLVIGLMAAAAFLLVAVAANRRSVATVDLSRRDSGTGGFALRATSSLPIRLDFGTPSGRARLAFPPEEESLYQGVRVFAFLTSPGEDISCRNIARATMPRLLGVPPEMIERGGFRVHTRRSIGTKNPWTLLEEPPEGGAIPAFADADSVVWNLHSGLEKVYSVPDEQGRPTPLRFVGVLPGSIFASEILVSERNFRRMFPSVSAPRTFLIETPPGQEGRIAHSLRRNLGDLGLEVRSTREVLASFRRVTETYLSTFLALGGLGMLLGTFGLVTALLRAVLERRYELALMLAAGFRRSQLVSVLVLENAALLLMGLFCGVLSAMVAVAPALASAGAPMDWRAPAATIAGMLGLGLTSCAVAAGASIGDQVVRALQEE